MSNKTAFENVAFALRVVEASSDEIEHKTMHVLEMMGLGHRKAALPHEMSGGEQQRICIARALVNDPAILLTDEPTGNLDPELSYEIMKVLLDIHERGTTVMVATHDATLVNRLQRRVLHLKEGKVVNDTLRGTYHDEA